MDLLFILRKPDSFIWTREEGFNARLQRTLLATHRIVLQPAATARKLIARETVLLRQIPKNMSRHQRMLLYYLLARCGLARQLTVIRNLNRTLAWCGKAEEIVHVPFESSDLGALVDLHEFRGTVQRAVSRFALAADEFAMALHIMREHSENGYSQDAEFEITVGGKAAALDFMLANYGRAKIHVERAERLLANASVNAENLGALHWAVALLHWLDDDLAAAAHHLDLAAQQYRKVGTISSTCRVLTLAAEIPLYQADLLAADESDPAYRDLLSVAAAYVDEAQLVGQVAKDAEGLLLNELARAHLDRLRGSVQGVAAGKRIRAVLKQARRLSDKSLLTESQVALGYYLLARGRSHGARREFDKAINTAANIQAPGLAFLAEKGLRNLGP